MRTAKSRILAGVIAIATLSGARSLLADDSRGFNHSGVEHYGLREDHRGRYTVRYHLDRDQRRHVDNRWEARRLVQALERVGADAHVDGNFVHYNMRGNARRTFERHGEAHRFEQWLGSLGFHVNVVER